MAVNVNVNVDDEYLKTLTKHELSCANCELLGFISGKQYSISDLEFIVKHTAVRLKSIVKTHKLTSDFCKKYILNPQYVVYDGDDITVDEVIHYQPHLYDELK